MKLRDLLSYRRKTIGYGIARECYLIVLGGSASLPSPRELCDPKGEIAAMIAPMGAGQDRSALDRPMNHGLYAVASPDRKTVIQLSVGGRDDSGFSAEAAIASPQLQPLGDEVIARMQGFWHVFALSFSSHDPMVYPALELQWRLAQRLAALTDGVVGDPLAERYLLPERGAGFSASQLVRIRCVEGLMVTAGMVKLGLPEFVIACGAGDESVCEKILLAGVDRVLQEGPFDPGQSFGPTVSPLMASHQEDGRIVWIPSAGREMRTCLEAFEQSK